MVRTAPGVLMAVALLLGLCFGHAGLGSHADVAEALRRSTPTRTLRNGVGHDEAHEDALTLHPPGRNYDPDVIDQFEEFGPWWRNMNGLPPR